MSAIAGVGDFGLQAMVNETKTYRDETLGFVNGRFPQTLTVYVDGTNGNDARTGLTNDTNATTGRVKTLARVASLYSDKVNRLEINVVGNVDVATDFDLKVNFCFIFIQSGAVLTWKKKQNVTDGGSTVVGDGTYSIRFMGFEININLSGNIVVEGNTGWNGSGSQYYYKNAQGAIKAYMSTAIIDYNRNLNVNIVGVGNINVGDNSIFFTASGSGANSDNINGKALYRRSYILGGTLTLGTNALESAFIYSDKTFPRVYTPINSTDANVLENEMCSDANFLYRKSSGTIKKIAWTAF